MADCYDNDGLHAHAVGLRLIELQAENDQLRARVAEVETWNANQARTMERVAEKMNAERRRAEAAEAKLAAVLAVPYCRDTGHTEAIHSAIGCCDPYGGIHRRGDADRG